MRAIHKLIILRHFKVFYHNRRASIVTGFLFSEPNEVFTAKHFAFIFSHPTETGKGGKRSYDQMTKSLCSLDLVLKCVKTTTNNSY